jgi:serine/threonine protein kinase
VIGKTLGHYRIDAKIGEGGMGIVYRAYDEVLRREVAVKVLNKEGASGNLPARDLLEEARASSSLSHPNICTIYEVADDGGDLYIAMELVPGKTLRAMTEGAGLAPELVLRYGIQIASALGRAHDRGIVHGDLKTANVVVSTDGLVKILDFGLARRVGGATDGTTLSLTPPQEASALSGTLEYMAPEVLRGEKSDCRSDLWALGVVLYEAVSGRLPFQGRTAFEVSSAILREIAETLGPPVPPGMWAIIQRCLAKDPIQRYQRASEVQAALEAILSGAIISSQPPPDQQQPRTTILHSVQHVPVKKGDFLLLVGTTKGAFIIRSSVQRRRWEIGGPYFHGHSVYAMAYDGRAGRHRIWASTQSYWGTLLRSSDDFGKSWTNPEQAPIRFPSDTGVSLKNIWQIALGGPEEPNVLYCGVEPAALFKTEDGGETWGLVRGLFDHPHRARWVPGNGGLALHTILRDPVNRSHMYVGISAGGVYRTTDAGITWTAQNRGIRVTFQPEENPEFGQCVHKMALHPAHPERIFLQNHWGVYRSEDCAESWTDVGNGLPSDFGFPVLVHPGNPDCVYVVPVESDTFRCACDGRLRVYRTRNAGASWEPLARGLPQKRAYETVLRDAMAADSLDPAGIYFGTRNGQLFGSSDEGRTWEMIHEGLPAVVCVRCAVVEDAPGSLATIRQQATARASSRTTASKRKQARGVRNKR